MAEEWRELALGVPATLLRVTGVITNLLETVDTAYSKLALGIAVNRRLRLGIEVNDNDFQDPPPVGTGAGTVIEFSRRELVYLRELHGKAGHVFAMYGALLGVLHGDPLWQRWEAHRAESLNHAAEAMQRLRSATSQARACGGAQVMAEVFPRLSPDWTSWIAATLNHYRRAIWEVTMARLALRRMRHAVNMEFFDAWMVLLNR
ncbi:hypothetical protein ACP70R_030526 [Stipagrostis hirtigluma subsp. patula]